MLITPASTNVTDCGLTNGTINVLVGSSDPDHTLNYGIDGPSVVTDQAASGFTALAAGTYNVKAYYSSGSGVTCRDSIDITLTSPQAITITGIDSTDSPDCGVAGGEIQVHATGSNSIEYSINGGTSYQPTNQRL